MHKKFYSFLTILFFIICLVPFHANADLGGMLKQLEKMGKKPDGLGEKKTPSPDQSAPSFQSSLTNRSFQFQWYLKQAGKRDYKVLSQQVYFGKKGKMWGLLSSKEKGMRNPYSYAVSGKWSLNGTKTCIEHKAVYAVTSPSYKLITKPARSYCYQFPKDGLAGLGLGKKWGDYRLATRQIPAFITENKNPGKYKKYNLAVVVNVAQKTGMIFLKHYKIASQKVKYRLARNKKRKKRAIREQKEKEDKAIKQAQQKAEQKARVKREMSTLSSFKNARGKWGVKFGMTKRQVGVSSKICTYHHNTTNPKYSSVSCNKELFGLKRTVYLSYRKNKVSGITVYLGKHTYSEWTKLHKILSRKYKVNYKANASDREMYNNKNTSRYLNLYDNGRILLQVSRECEKRGGKYSNYKCLWHRNVTKLVYWDDIEAKAFMKLIKKRSKKEDL